MTIRSCSATNILAPWFSLALACAVLWPAAGAAQSKKNAKRAPSRPAAASSTLAPLVRAWRESPSTARRSAVERYAAAHPRDESGSLARLALGIGSYEQKSYTAAISELGKLGGKLPALADYTAYYLAAARVESDDPTGVLKELAAIRAAGVPSPLAGKAWLLEARALQDADPEEAVRLLRDRYADLPQPEGDLTLAACYQSAKELDHAADFYQRVYYRFTSGEAASRAAAALVTLKDLMGPDYPQPLPEQMLRRADRLLEQRDFRRARSEYSTLSGQLSGLARDRALVRMGAADYLDGRVPAARAYLRALDFDDSEADAERLYYLVECARKLSNDDEMMAALDRLKKSYRKSPWRLKALVTAGNRFLLVNQPDDYVPLYKAAYEDFPDDPLAGRYHWKVAFNAYMRGKGNADDLMREHLRTYSPQPTTGAALYFLGRYAEQHNDFGEARGYYQRLAEAYPNHYYAMLARERLARPEVRNAGIPAKTVKFLSEVTFIEARPPLDANTPETTLRIERSRLLRAAGLDDLADTELRYGARNGGQGELLAMEMAGAADAPYQALRIMKNIAPGYLYLGLDQAPRRFWELLFPLPYRTELTARARERDLDPFLVAGLIRQESEFNPQARSPANAYGLTQVRPSTGRLYARRAGVTRYSSRVLLQPAANLKIGTFVLRSMLDQNGGRLEQTLAAYNAGPNRLAEWLTWSDYREPAEFVESIPFTETRDYVQAVLRNADIYRRLYR